MMSQGGNEVDNTYRLADLIQHLQVIQSVTPVVLSQHLKSICAHRRINSVFSPTDSKESVVGEEEGKVCDDKGENTGFYFNS